jgi:methylmalonyl-CoA/ethylmalonyl-CoA epimerase
MKLDRLNHIGVATPSIEASIVLYRDVMGACIGRNATL